MKTFRSVIEKISDIGRYISGWLVALMMVIVLYEVFMRYVINRPPMIADEFSAYMLVAVAYLGTAYTFRKKGHVRITSLVTRLPPRVADWLRVITLALGFIFSLVLLRSGYEYMISSFRIHEKSSTWLHVPLQGPQLTVVIGFFIFSLILLFEAINAVLIVTSGGRLEEQGSVETNV